MGLSGISQAGALRELSFSISASRVKLLPPEAEHRTPFVICRLDLCLSRDPRWGSSRSCEQERDSLVGLIHGREDFTRLTRNGQNLLW
jgi:hypothetical protein